MVRYNAGRGTLRGINIVDAFEKNESDLAENMYDIESNDCATSSKMNSLLEYPLQVRD